MKKCHNCKATGKVPTKKRLKKFPNIKRLSACYYCKGVGKRI